MVKIMISAKVKKTGDFVQDIIVIDDAVYKIDNDSLYGIVSDFLDEKYGDVFKWFRFWTIP